MNRPISALPKRPARGTARTARTRKDAAIHLVRLEFDIGRLADGIAQVERRRDLYAAELAVKTRERSRLLGILGA
ncbi:hypothetical protein [Roseivivax isoporae]|uniref:Uncharacterized protein n=1 Tax=Roseivivax isoporae LMG 25204 TaxID=1449351 RepID=X7FB59_9RHOB|nr:hypothetical protein [Roseivivax isoporae]ETX29351.1 hypothetical protein RISW2_01390 [Roseivivax isoporae LMG 25204]